MPREPEDLRHGARRLLPYRAPMRFIAFALVLGAVILVLVIPLPNPWRSTWRSKLLDLGHIPLFALLTVAIYRNLRLGLIFALCIATATAGACELAQLVVHRSADFSDFLRGVIGSLLVVVLVRGLRAPRKVSSVLVHTAIAAALLTWPLMDAVPKLWDAINAYRSFPIICDFQTRWESHRWTKDRATVERVTGDEWQQRWVGRMEFFPNGTGSGAVVLFPVNHNWSSYHQLCCDFFVPDEPVNLLISIRDGRRVTGSRKRFDMERQYPAGDHHVCIDLQSLARGAEFSPLDLTRVESFHLVVRHMEESRTIYLRSVRLQ